MTDRPPASSLAGTPDRRTLLGALAAGCAVAAFRPGAGRAQRAGLDTVRRRARGFDQMRALVVARDGEILLAEAFRGPPVDRPVNVKSVSKTIVASLVGAAIDRGVLDGVDSTFAAVAPSLVPPDADPRVRRITIADLLTMQAGLERTSGPNYGRWVQSSNWVAHALSRPFVAEPGDGMLYSTGSYHLLGAALARATGRSLLDLARDWLGGPLGIGIAPWTRDPQGFYMGGNNMALSPLAMVRFGETWRAGGVWNGARVLSRDWIEASWTPRTTSVFSGDDYGYGWFLTRAGGHDVAYARGYGGQMIYVVPGAGLTVAVTSDSTQSARSEGYAGDLKAMLAEDIIPALAAA
ncbi:MAG: serine hydrolase [Thalassobaculum sp.]|uniref:serine hydrolase domain-containing protein n=1 Tax=Thalassobaculum sp. TaxID=2022740 RepID=UPI0032F019F6